ncbi:S-layer homology domain-containing protein [Cohnella suwonensis]|uniref:S-layer homology domain-containing protein n=1 Tax=Cohnella suwonensis TaxID=696072 RepID=A0ABW0LSW1_9BACL
MKKGLLILLVAVLISVIPMRAGAVEVAVTSAAFKDVPTTHWAYAYVMEAVEKGIVKGFPNGTFKPNDPVTVAQFLQMMFLSMAEKDESGKLYWAKAQVALVPDWVIDSLYDPSISFTQGSPWYINYVKSAKALGVIREQQYDGRFNENLTRERAAWMINTLDGYFRGPIGDDYAKVAGPQFFKDLSRALDDYSRYEISKVALRGIMTGNNGFFNPTAFITRAEAVKIVSLLPDASKRSPAKVNLTGVPYSMVKNPGYDDGVFVFANAEMKKVYDTLRSSQSSFAGVTDSAFAHLGYYQNDEMKEKAFKQNFYLDFNDQNIYDDLNFGFTGNNYTISLGTNSGFAERASKPLNEMLAMIYKDPDPVKKLIDTAVVSSRDAYQVNLKKTFEHRDILITSTGRKFLLISIGAYSDM